MSELRALVVMKKTLYAAPCHSVVAGHFNDILTAIDEQPEAPAPPAIIQDTGRWEYDDGSVFELGSIAGGGSEGGEFSYVTFRYTDAEGKSVDWKYNREAPAPPDESDNETRGRMLMQMAHDDERTPPEDMTGHLAAQVRQWAHTTKVTAEEALLEIGATLTYFYEHEPIPAESDARIKAEGIRAWAQSREATHSPSSEYERGFVAAEESAIAYADELFPTAEPFGNPEQLTQADCDVLTGVGEESTCTNCKCVYPADIVRDGLCPTCFMGDSCAEEAESEAEPTTTSHTSGDMSPPAVRLENEAVPRSALKRTVTTRKGWTQIEEATGIPMFDFIHLMRNGIKGQEIGEMLRRGESDKPGLQEQLDALKAKHEGHRHGYDGYSRRERTGPPEKGA